MLTTRTNGRARSAAATAGVVAVTYDGVVVERVNYTAWANQNAGARVAVDHVLIDSDAGNAGSAIAGTDTAPAVHGNLTIPNEYVYKSGGCRRFGKNSIRAVVGKHRIACRYYGTRSGVQAISVAD